MTREQFNKWKDGYFDAFPDTLAWLNKTANPAKTLGTWFDCMVSCDFQDVLTVTAKLITGELASIDGFQVGNTPRHIRAYAGRIADDRNKRTKSDRERNANVAKRQGFRTVEGPSMGSMFKEIIKFREEGQSQGLAGVELNEYASERMEGFIASNGQRIGSMVESEPRGDREPGDDDE